MFENLKESFKKAREEVQKKFAEELEGFNDPVAKEIEWNSISGTGFGYRNRQLQQNKHGDIVFNPTIQAILFPAAFWATGYYVMHISALKNLSFMQLLYNPVNTIQFFIDSFTRSCFANNIYGLAFGLAFFIMGLIMTYYAVSPIVFNTNERIFYKGFFPKSEKCVALQDVHAIQLLTTLGNDPDSDTTYELNLVLKDKRRVNVFAHSNKKAVRENAARLAQALDIPVWDIIKH